jgi:type IV secretion system protein VirB3
MTGLPEGFEMTVNRSLTEPIMFAGVPKAFALLLWTGALCIILGLYQLWFLPVAIALHVLFAALTKRDPHFFEIFLRAIRRQRPLVP